MALRSMPGFERQNHISILIVCEGVECENGGECVYSRTEDKGICKCLPGFGGDRCQLLQGI